MANKNQTELTQRLWAKMTSKDIVIGEGATAGIVKAHPSDCSFGYIYILPGGETTRSKVHAKKVAAHINWLLMKAA